MSNYGSSVACVLIKRERSVIWRGAGILFMEGGGNVSVASAILARNLQKHACLRLFFLTRFGNSLDVPVIIEINDTVYTTIQIYITICFP